LGRVFAVGQKEGKELKRGNPLSTRPFLGLLSHLRNTILGSFRSERW